METFVSRQPIFDRDERLFGYEVSLCSLTLTVGGGTPGPEELFVAAVLGHGIDRVSGGAGNPLLLTVDRSMMESRSIELLPPTRVIAQLVGAEAEQEESAAGCATLRALGYRVALHPTDPRAVPDALLRVAHLVKVDVDAFGPGELAEIAARLRAFQLRPVALNVRHLAERATCAALGFDLFRGFRFTAPETLVRRDVAPSTAAAFRVFKLVRDPKTSDAQIESAIGGDVALSYKLLRMVNSSAVGGREIWSIGHAIRLLGREPISRWLALVLVADRAKPGVQGELRHLALVRARMAEQIAISSGVPRAAGSLFLAGLLSPLDQLLETPMDVLVSQMELAPDLGAALLHRRDHFGSVLSAIEAYERGAWGDIEELEPVIGIRPQALGVLYLDAIEWATDQVRRAA
jgi:EAL and modified HD-GYP domain-containing signal transduction protein